jgi:ABC-type glutathione transport system ATPase component
MSETGTQVALRYDGVSIHLGGSGDRTERGEGTLIVKNASLSLEKGRVTALVGESGSGKTTLALSALGRYPLSSGKILVNDREVGTTRDDLRDLRRRIQMVYQDPFGAFPPWLRVADIVTDPLVAHGLLRGGRRHRAERLQVAQRLLEECQLDGSKALAKPHALSGGELQRVAFARAIGMQPEILLADEPTSALDVLIQAQLLELMKELQRRHHMTTLLISHNLAVVRYLADYGYVMHRGEIVEHGPIHELLENPQEQYTRDLVAAVADPSRPVDQRTQGGGGVPPPSAPETALLERHLGTWEESIQTDSGISEGEMR